MRPTLDLRPLTLIVVGTLATIAKTDSVTFQADHSWTPKGWLPAVRPLSRRNAVAAVVAAIHASDHMDSMEAWLALPLWNRPGKVVEGWSNPTHADHGCRVMVEGAIVAEVARLAVSTLASMDAQALASLESMEGERITKGKLAPFPVAGGKVQGCALPPPAPAKGKRGKGK